MAFSDVLKRLRKDAGLTQEQLAERLKYTRSRISNYEQGTREPDLESLEEIADFFNVDMNILFGMTQSEIDVVSAMDEIIKLLRKMDFPDSFRNLVMYSYLIPEDERTRFEVMAKALNPSVWGDVMECAWNAKDKD